MYIKKRSHKQLSISAVRGFSFLLSHSLLPHCPPPVLLPLLLLLLLILFVLLILLAFLLFLLLFLTPFSLSYIFFKHS